MIGTVELGGLIAARSSASRARSGAGSKNIDINALGLVIGGMFVATWAIALSVWRYARIEERWGASIDQL